MTEKKTMGGKKLDNEKMNTGTEKGDIGVHQLEKDAKSGFPRD